jgi:nucleoside-triphosphatase
VVTPANLLVTGPPRSGKTTVVQRVSQELESRGYRAGGVYCPEIRSDGERVGFEIVDAAGGESQILAHVDRADGPSVGKYRVDVDGVDALCAMAFERAFEAADFVVVDEIAPMELYSETFVRQVRRALDSDLPVVAAVQYASREGFVGEVTDRDDTRLFEVTGETRDELPGELVRRLLSDR